MYKNNIMDSSLNNYENENEDIRRPDEVKTEQLMEDTRSDYDKQIDEAIYISLLEMKQDAEINKNYEEKIINNYYDEIHKRTDKFCDLLLGLNKLIRFDKKIKEIYEIIEPIIDSYCSQFIEFAELDEETYDTIFKVIGTIRTNKINIENLKLLIIKNKI